MIPNDGIGPTSERLEYASGSQFVQGTKSTTTSLLTLRYVDIGMLHLGKVHGS